MLLILSFFKKVGQVLFGSPETTTTSKKRTRTLRIEELEPRIMLSVSPLDWDIWENTTPIHSIPAEYNINPSSDDFGKISIGGNNSQIDATTAFTPSITGNFSAYETVTRQGDVSKKGAVVGAYTETITVGIFSQDLGGGNWSYIEQVAYSYSYGVTEYVYADGYGYSLSVSFIDGIYDSTFSMSVGYGYTDSISVEVVESDFTFSWDVTAGYSYTDTATITYFHNTLTSERSNTDTRTTNAIGFYSEGMSFLYDTTDYSVNEAFSVSETYITDSFITISLGIVNNEWVVVSGYGHDSLSDSYDYSDSYNESYSEDDLSYLLYSSPSIIFPFIFSYKFVLFVF
jgi:hypothetical protein